MKRRGNARSRGSDNNEENIRGLLREKEKTIKQLRQENRYLRKQLLMANEIAENEEEDTQPVQEKKAKCKNCHSENLAMVDVHKPNGVLKFLVCQDCKHREKHE